MTHADYCGFHRWDWMESLTRVLRERALVGIHIRRYGWDDLPSDYKPRYPDRDYKNYRTWYGRETDNAPMHPAIRQAVYLAPPANWHLLVLEHPHAADSDPSRIAYTRSDAHGEADRQTVTSVGKYLTRHFPTLADHHIRDIVMRHGANRFEMWRTVPDIVRSVQDGPHSCMRWERYNKDSGATHPYEVYDPEYGWRAAVRVDGNGIITARCLVNIEEMTFVRSYTRKDGEYSHSDEAIEVWLRDQGYTKNCSWAGLRLRRINTDRCDDDFWAPYLDGDCKNVHDCGDHLLIEYDGDYTFDRTDGHADGSSRATCSDCGARHDEDDMHHVGYHCDEAVGPCCIDGYVYVLGRNTNEYWIPQSDAVYVESQDQHYDSEYLERNGIVELDNGDYEHRDDAVYLEQRQIWVHNDDECWVQCNDSCTTEHIDDCVQLANGDWALEENAWQCEHDEEWYLSDDVSPFETDCGKSVHPDHAHEYITINEEN